VLGSGQIPGAGGDGPHVQLPDDPPDDEHAVNAPRRSAVVEPQGVEPDERPFPA
jgi:hypothetical protein